MKKIQIEKSATRLIAAAALLLTGASAAQARDVILPADGAEMNRTHIQFRWEHESNAISDYYLEVVVDSGAPNPFLGATPVVFNPVPNDEPRTIVTSGLQWGTNYAWRVQMLVGPSPGTRVVTPTRRFSTLNPVRDLMDANEVPEFTLEHISGNGGEGVTMWSTVRRGAMGFADRGFLLAVDATGELIWYHATPISNWGDMRMMPNGRVLGIRNEGNGSPAGLECTSVRVVTLDGLTTWATKTDYCLVDPYPQDENGNDLALGPHHEVYAMPESAPNGANFLVDQFDNRTIASYTDPYDGQTYTNVNVRGDSALEIDRHTRAAVWEVNTFDYMDLDDHLPVGHPSNAGGFGGNWNHTNAIEYDEFFNRVLFSNRRQSRVVAIDYNTKQMVWRVGDDSILGFGPGGVGFGNWPSASDPSKPPLLGLGGNEFSWQHAPQGLPNGNFMIYDNGNYTEPFDPMDLLANRVTRAMEIGFDDPMAPTSASVVWEYTITLEDLMTPAFARFVGDADRLANGNTIMCDGEHANIMEVDAAGNLVWFLNAGPDVIFGPSAGLPPGNVIYRVERYDELIREAQSDTDGDWDVDMLDLAELQVSYGNASGGGGALEFPETLSDHDDDGDLDADDVNGFNYWMTGPAAFRLQ